MPPQSVPTHGIELLARTLCDSQPPSRTDGAYLFAQTEDNEASVFDAACHLLNTDSTSRILIPETDPQGGYPGYSAWQLALLQRGIAAECIQGVPTGHPDRLHTLIEAEACIHAAQRHGLRSLQVIAAPFHQLRAFMTMVTVAVREQADLGLYSYPGVAQPWHEQVVHSQGTLTATRQDLILSELERIDRYQRKGDLGSYELVLTYLNQRDRRP